MVSSTLLVLLCAYQLMWMSTGLVALILGDLPLVGVCFLGLFDFVEMQEANYSFKVFCGGQISYDVVY